MPRNTPRNAEVAFKGGKHSNASHASITGPDARLCRKSRGTGLMANYYAALLAISGSRLFLNRKASDRCSFSV